MPGTIGNHGYRAFILRRENDSKPHRRLAHRLVAAAFLPPPLPGQTDVCHNDGDGSNNCVENLRWDTHRNNQRDMLKHRTAQCGSACVTAKLTEEHAREIYLSVRSGSRGVQKAMAEKFGISRAQVCRIANGRRWAFQLHGSPNDITPGDS